MNETDDLRQACAVPLRRQGEASEVCLITSIKKGLWGFPKGMIEPGQTPQQAALSEAEEEAGLHGRILGASLGRYTYHKWSRRLQVEAFLMWVDRVDDHWLESDLRRRRWCSSAEAPSWLAKKEQRQLLSEALRRIERDQP